MKIKVDLNKLTLDDLISLEEKTVNYRFMRSLVARFAVNDDGSEMTPDEAMTAAGLLKIGELGAVMNQIVGSVSATVSPPSGGS